jgi:hypothetical protein
MKSRRLIGSKIARSPQSIHTHNFCSFPSLEIHKDDSSMIFPHFWLNIPCQLLFCCYIRSGFSFFGKKEGNAMKFHDVEISSIGELISLLRSNLAGIGAPVWFRGQSNSDWSLVPRLMRMDPIPSESYYLNRFKQDASIILDRQPKTEFEWLFLMQHYGVPTRLLDWSESPLTALYFALSGEHAGPGALWALSPSELNKKAHYRPDFDFEIPSFEDEHLKGYLPSTIARESKSKLFPMAAIAPRNSPRMQSQQGVFTICHREPMPIEEVGAVGSPRDHVWRYIIPLDGKENLRQELQWLGINRFKLFPELESLAGLF